jgi:hypothetical protein
MSTVDYSKVGDYTTICLYWDEGEVHSAQRSCCIKSPDGCGPSRSRRRDRYGRYQKAVAAPHRNRRDHRGGRCDRRSNRSGGFKGLCSASQPWPDDDNGTCAAIPRWQHRRGDCERRQDSGHSHRSDNCVRRRRSRRSSPGQRRRLLGIRRSCRKTNRPRWHASRWRSRPSVEHGCKDRSACAKQLYGEGVLRLTHDGGSGHTFWRSNLRSGGPCRSGRSCSGRSGRSRSGRSCSGRPGSACRSGRSCSGRPGSACRSGRSRSGRPCRRSCRSRVVGAAGPVSCPRLSRSGHQVR